MRVPWDNVVVTDSKNFWLVPKGGVKKVRVKYDDNPVHEKVYRNNIKVHGYVGVTKSRPSQKGRKPLIVPVGIIIVKVDKKGVNDQVCKELLKENLIPACKKMTDPVYGPTGWVFQPGSAQKAC